MLDRLQRYQPSKTQTFWLCIICIVATLVLGFTWGGWVTQGTAQEMAEEAAEKARVQLAAAVCVEKFKQSADAGARLDELKETSSYSRDELVEDGGWATMPGQDAPDSEVSEACAERLAELEEIPESAKAAQAAAAAQGDDDATSVQ